MTNEVLEKSFSIWLMDKSFFFELHSRSIERSEVVQNPDAISTEIKATFSGQ